MRWRSLSEEQKPFALLMAVSYTHLDVYKIQEILTTLYFSEMRSNPKLPAAERDKCVLCKGHAAPALYAVLAHRGYFPREELLTLRQLGSRLQGHPDMKKTPGVDASTGSLGQGGSIAVGLALGARLSKSSQKIFALSLIHI